MLTLFHHQTRSFSCWDFMFFFLLQLRVAAWFLLGELGVLVAGTSWGTSPPTAVPPCRQLGAGEHQLLRTAAVPDVGSKGSPSWRIAMMFVTAVQQLPVLISKLNLKKNPTNLEALPASG